MKLPGVAVATLCVVVASKISSLASTAYEGPPYEKKEKLSCGDADSVKKVGITLPNSVLTLTCAVGDTMKPPVTNQPTKVCGDDACNNAEVAISSLCPGATIKQGGSAAEAVITIPQLPTSTKVFYMQCILSGNQVKCKAEVTVQAAAPQGPQSCAEPGGSVTLQIEQEGGKAYFGCGKGLSLYPIEDTKALSADCAKSEDAKDLKRTITSAPQSNYVELTATKKKKKTFCYLCKKGGMGMAKGNGTEGECKVFVHVSGSAQLLRRVIFALTLPFVLTLQHFLWF